MINLHELKKAFILDNMAEIEEKLVQDNVQDYSTLKEVIENFIDKATEQEGNNFLQEELNILAADYLYSQLENLSNEFIDMLEYNSNAQR